MSTLYLNWLTSQYSTLKNISHYIYTYVAVIVGLAVIIMLSLAMPLNGISAHKEGIYTVLKPYPFGQGSVLGGEDLAKQFPNTLPKADMVPAKRVYYVSTTAYNSDPGQTDDTPCITANGFNVCEHNTENIVATNMLPFGTKVRFPELHGDKVFIVMDRMNSRYTTRVDFWMIDKQDARAFGIKHSVKMEVL